MRPIVAEHLACIGVQALVHLADQDFLARCVFPWVRLVIEPKSNFCC